MQSWFKICFTYILCGKLSSGDNCRLINKWNCSWAKKVYLGCFHQGSTHSTAASATEKRAQALFHSFSHQGSIRANVSSTLCSNLIIATHLDRLSKLLFPGYYCCFILNNIDVMRMLNLTLHERSNLLFY